MPCGYIIYNGMLYRYNSKFMQDITDYVHPIFGIKGNGFRPLKGKLNKMKIRNKTKDREQTNDSLKICFINKLIDETEGVNLLFVASPSWYGSPLNDYQPIQDICKRRGIKFIDFSNSEKYVHCDKYFKDGNHLNASGADEYTSELVQIINKDL